jgi:hypothetical protein
MHRHGEECAYVETDAAQRGFLEEQKMKLSAFLDELIAIEAARMAGLYELRARLTGEPLPDDRDAPFDMETQTQARASDIDTVFGANADRQPARQPSQPLSEIRDPLAKSLNTLVTPKQLGLIRGLCRELTIDADEECQRVLRCRTEELSKKAASSFIDHLQALQKEAGIKRA